MNEETNDFYEHQAERTLLSRTGRTRPMGHKDFLGRKEWEKMNGPVIVKSAFPQLPTLRDRLLYLQGTMTQKEFAQKCKIGYSTFAAWLGKKNTPRRESAKEICDACGCTIEWLLGTQTQDADRAEPQDEPRDAPVRQETLQAGEAATVRGMTLTLRGEYHGADVMRYLSGLCDNTAYAVQIDVREV